jgi:hypothetical protein
MVLERQTAKLRRKLICHLLHSYLVRAQRPRSTARGQATLASVGFWNARLECIFHYGKEIGKFRPLAKVTETLVGPKCKARLFALEERQRSEHDIKYFMNVAAINAHRIHAQAEKLCSSGALVDNGIVVLVHLKI